MRFRVASGFRTCKANARRTHHGRTTKFRRSPVALAIVSSHSLGGKRMGMVNTEQQQQRMRQLLNHYLTYCDLQEIAVSSQRVYRQNLGDWLRWRAANGHPDDPRKIDVAELRAHFSYLKHEHIPHRTNTRRPALDARGLSHASRNLRWRVLAAFWRYLAEEGHLRRDQKDYFTARRVPCPSVPKRKRKGVEADAVALLLATCDASERGCRDRAIILILAQTGMRISEVAGVEEKRCNLAEREALIIGKGSKERMVFWGCDAADAIGAYLAVRRASTGGYLFLGVGSRSDPEQHIRSDALREMLHARAKEAGVTLPEGQPAHGFRRGFARRSLRRGMPAPHLQQILGHANAATLQIYVEEEADEELRRIHRQFWDDDHYGTP